MTPLDEQLERLLSEQHDGDTTARQLAELRRVLAQDPQAAKTARQYERLQLVLGAWRALDPGVDWQTLSQQTAQRVEEEAQRLASAQVDARIESTAAEAGPDRATEAGPDRASDAASVLASDAPSVLAPGASSGIARGDSSEGASEAASEGEGEPVGRFRREFEAVDELVRGWAKPRPEVDWDGFKTRVSSAVRQEALRQAAERQAAERQAVERQAAERQAEKRKAVERPSWQETGRQRLAPRRIWATPLRRVAGWTITVAAPLAAAAAIAIAVWWPRGELPAGGAATPSGRAPIILVSLDAPEATGQVQITFDLRPGEGVAEPNLSEPVGSAIAMSAGGADAGESFDDALFY